MYLECHWNNNELLNIREEQVSIKGAEECIDTCMYVWRQAEVYVRREVGVYMCSSK